ncbi:hypothetical protein CERSUDRAFT_76167 [Gelatoporia subvermispora B]|uniref:Protein FRA10AC1 n=1 Tax=Ceriporiopsis subvermispora (strain B) TaxID=914234 RepID=M2R535_CERS8|nr:hypothetical protein CERSUDRAFT_76167 [Gelatoporia subvermispora B]
MPLLEKHGSTSKAVSAPPKTEFDVLKASHRFLREDEPEGGLTWEEQVAKKYYDNLYREYAVCDLKHYKTGNFALRWRTENEVVSGAGETTCGNTRCPLHKEHGEDEIQPALTTLELPFSYVETGENKFALVKVVLCEKCVKKLMWKRRKEKDLAAQAQDKSGDEEEDRDGTQARDDERESSERNRSSERRHRRKRDEREDERGSGSGGKDKHGRDREEHSSRKRRRRSLSRVPRAKSGSA